MTLQPAFDFERQGLDFLWLEVTKKCNLECLHCYAESSPQAPLLQRMTYDDWRRTLQQAWVLGCRKVQFIGGEPTLYPRLPDLIEEARGIGYEFIEVFTNGTTLSDPLLDTFKRCAVRVAFSFYGPSADVHEQVTTRTGSFERTLGNIRKAVNLGLPVRVGIIAMGLNAGRVQETRALLNGLGVTSVRVDRVRGIGRGGALSPNPDQQEELCGACWRGKLCITADGSVFPCVFARFCRVGDARCGLDAVNESTELNQFRRQMRKDQGGGQACDPESEDCAPGCEPKPGVDYCHPDYSKDDPCEPSARHCYPNTPCHP